MSAVSALTVTPLEISKLFPAAKVISPAPVPEPLVAVMSAFTTMLSSAVTPVAASVISPPVLLRTAVLMELLGLQVVVNETATTDEALVFSPQRSCTWKSFSSITSVVIDEPGIGKKIRVWEHGIPLVTDPKSIHVTTDTVV